MSQPRAFFAVPVLFTLGCHSAAESPAPLAPDPACLVDGGAPSTCISPQEDAGAYYVAQALLYFDTIDTSVAPGDSPNYSTLVARWEWPPWLKLTGFGKEAMVEIDQLLKNGDPAAVPLRDCRAFGTQPFARCRISFQYTGGMCPIYEEFTFNQDGETTFIEAWSNQPGLLPMPDPSADPWGEGPGVHRLSTKLPGLGDAHGLIQLDAGWMQAAAAKDPEIADFVNRAGNFFPTWSAEYAEAGADLYARGCGW